MRRTLAVAAWRAVLAISAVAPSACSDDPEIGYEGRTTDGERARRNLDSQIAGLLEARDRNSGHPDIAPQLLERRSQRARIFGTADELLEELREIERRARRSPTPAWFELAAKARLALGHADAAVRWLDRAEALDGRRREVLRARADLLARRDVEAARVILTRHAEAFPSFEARVMAANAHVAAGYVPAAEDHFLRALRGYQGTSPFPVAEAQRDRARMWAGPGGRPDVAAALYREALRRVPGYVVARDELRALEAQ